MFTNFTNVDTNVGTPNSPTHEVNAQPSHSQAETGASVRLTKEQKAAYGDHKPYGMV